MAYLPERALAFVDGAVTTPYDRHPEEELYRLFLPSDELDEIIAEQLVTGRELRERTGLDFFRLWNEHTGRPAISLSGFRNYPNNPEDFLAMVEVAPEMDNTGKISLQLVRELGGFVHKGEIDV